MKASVGVFALVSGLWGCSGSEDANETSNGGRSGTSATGGAAGAPSNTKPAQPNSWHIEVSGDTLAREFDIPKQTNSLIDISVPTPSGGSNIYLNAPTALTIHLGFQEPFERIVPFESDEGATNYLYAAVAYQNLFEAKSFECRGRFDLRGDEQAVTGRFSLRVDSAEPQPITSGPVQYLIHGEFHATCPIRNADAEETIDVSATF